MLEAALVGLPHATLGEVPAALVRRRPGAVLDEAMLRAFAAERLAAFKVPVRVIVSDMPLPRNEGGKLVKPAVARAFA